MRYTASTIMIFLVGKELWKEKRACMYFLQTLIICKYRKNPFFSWIEKYSAFFHTLVLHKRIPVIKGQKSGEQYHEEEM